jgi:ribosomal protein S17E
MKERLNGIKHYTKSGELTGLRRITTGAAAINCAVNRAAKRGIKLKNISDGRSGMRVGGKNLRDKIYGCRDGTDIAPLGIFPQESRRCARQGGQKAFVETYGKEYKSLPDNEIHLVYLPGYSPNLNLIDRYCGFLKNKILANRYFSSFGEFREAIMLFSRSKSKKLRNAIRKYIPEKFHLFKQSAT